jgi:hypothetical protein
MRHRLSSSPPAGRQRGAAAVEFALVSLLFFTLLFGILEFGRMLYLYNTVQEVTRRAAREAVVRWVDETDAIKTLALSVSALPAAPELTAANITIRYLNKSGAEVTLPPTDPGDNLSACGDNTRTASCIDSVRVSIDNVSYTPMVSLFGFLNIAVPASVVVMHAESLGFQIN